VRDEGEICDLSSSREISAISYLSTFYCFLIVSHLSGYFLTFPNDLSFIFRVTF